jgi:hypothetical protein
MAWLLLIALRALHRRQAVLMAWLLLIALRALHRRQAKQQVAS